MSASGVSRQLRRGAFWTYALLLVIATHWPGLAIDAPTPIRADVAIHVVALAVWTVALAGCAYFGQVTSRRNVLIAGTIAIAYAMVDELTQGVPALRRRVDGADLIANVLGVGMGVMVMALARRHGR